jgi:uncharacterized protein (UPF0333 family)
MIIQNNNDCASVEEQLSAFIDNELEPKEACCVEAHIEQCERCKTIKNELIYMSDSLKSIESVLIPPGFDSNLKAALQRKKPIYAWIWNRNRSLGFAAALLMIGIISFSMIGNLTSGNGTPSTSSMSKSAGAPTAEESVQAPQTYGTAADSAIAADPLADKDMQVYYDLIAEKLSLYQYEIISTSLENSEITINILTDAAGKKIDRLLVFSYKDGILSIEDNWLNIKF